MELKDMVAIVTGSSRGIGKGIAKEFGKAGARVVVAARTEERGGRLPGTIHETVAEIIDLGGEALPIRCDVTSEEDVQALVERVMEEYGRIDVLVNNAGILFRGLITDTMVRHWDLIMRVNLKGPFLMCKFVLPVMMEQRRGSIINITSGAATSRSPGGVPYGVTKAGLNQLTIGLAEEMREHNISVNSMDPGLIKSEGAVATQPPSTDWSRFEDPSMMGPACIFLALQDAGGVTGRILKRIEFGQTWP